MARLRYRPVLEVLEDRLLLSGTSAVSAAPTGGMPASSGTNHAILNLLATAYPPSHAEPATLTWRGHSLEDHDSSDHRRDDADGDEYRAASGLALLLAQAAGGGQDAAAPSPLSGSPRHNVAAFPEGKSSAGAVAPSPQVDPLPLGPTPLPASVAAGRSASPDAQQAASPVLPTLPEQGAAKDALSVTTSLQLVAGQACRLALEPAAPLTALVQVDLHKLEERVDAFFEHLARLGERGEAGRFCLDLAPWLLLGAAAAWELAFLRRRVRERPLCPSPCDRIALSLEEG
jgi:hypothetical protein